MNIAIGSDHAGYQTKLLLAEHLKSSGFTVFDLGPSSNDPVDYPDYAQAVARMVASNDTIKGILICGTGIGMSISANKVSGIRAALCRTVNDAELSRRHNNANVLALGSRVTDMKDVIKIADIWLKTGFDGGRHLKRVNKIEQLEIIS